MKLDYYERHLLALAMEACAERGLRIDFDHNKWWIDIPSIWRIPKGASTLSEVITALLTDLGVQVPERPSEEAVRAERQRLMSYGQHWRLWPRDPLLAAAVLEAGS